MEVGLRSGINYIDTSPFYGDGKSEEVLGQALRRVPRHTYYIATKVGRYSSDWKKAFDFSAETVVREFENSLRRLQLTYVDLVQVHDFEFRQDPEFIARVTLPAVRSIVESGKARYCGITGYPLEEFRKVLDLSPVRVDTVLSYTRNTFIDNTLEVDINSRVGQCFKSSLFRSLSLTSSPRRWASSTPLLQGWVC